MLRRLERSSAATSVAPAPSSEVTDRRAPELVVVRALDQFPPPAWVARGLDKLGAALTAWVREQPPAGPMWPSEVFAALTSRLAFGVLYDVDALAVVHRGRDPAFTLPADGNPSARLLLAALRIPGSKMQLSGEQLELVHPTPATVAEHQELSSIARRGRVAGGPPIAGLAYDVWYDGATPLDVRALIGDVSEARRRAVERAEALVSHRWRATDKNAFHGLAADSVWTDTPDATYQVGGFASDGGVNIGLPYFYGGYSDVDGFDRGIAAGLPAGHVFQVTPTFRADNAFTPLGVGLDCSGFISRAWGLDAKIGTPDIEERTKPLQSYDALRPGDVCMKVLQHVMLFVGRDGDKLLFMESTPPRCIGLAYTASQLERLQMLPRSAEWLDGDPR